MRIPSPYALGMAGSLALAAAAGVFASTAIGTSSQQAERTVTITLAGGPTGATGPPGPPGPAGTTGATGPAGLACPQGFSQGELVINHPGGQTAIWTCLRD